jgi:hypothetical protein
MAVEAGGGAAAPGDRVCRRRARSCALAACAKKSNLPSSRGARSHDCKSGSRRAHTISRAAVTSRAAVSAPRERGSPIAVQKRDRAAQALLARGPHYCALHPTAHRPVPQPPTPSGSGARVPAMLLCIAAHSGRRWPSCVPEVAAASRLYSADAATCSAVKGAPPLPRCGRPRLRWHCPPGRPPAHHLLRSLPPGPAAAPGGGPAADARGGGRQVPGAPAPAAGVAAGPRPAQGRQRARRAAALLDVRRDHIQRGARRDGAPRGQVGPPRAGRLAGCASAPAARPPPAAAALPARAPHHRLPAAGTGSAATWCGRRWRSGSRWRGTCSCTTACRSCRCTHRTSTGAALLQLHQGCPGQPAAAAVRGQPAAGPPPAPLTPTPADADAGAGGTRQLSRRPHPTCCSMRAA